MMRSIAFLAALAIFVVIQSQLFMAHDYPSVFRDFDGVRYLELAQRGGQDAFHGPAYSTAIRVVSSIGIEPYAAAKLISRVSGLIVLCMSWLVFRRMTGPLIAGCATLLIVVVESFITLGHAIMSDMFATAFFWIALAAAIVPKERRIGISAGLGAAIGLSYLTRYGNLALAIIPIALLIGSKESLMNRSRHAIATTLGFLVVAGSHILDVFRNPNLHLFGENHYNVAFRVLSGGKDYYQFGQVPVNSIFDVIRLAPSAFFTNWGSNLGHVPLQLSNFFGAFGILMLAALPMWWIRRDLFRVTLGLAILVYLSLVGTAWIDDRTLLPALPLAAFLLAEGVAVCVRGLTMWSRMVGLREVMAVIMIGLISFETAHASTEAVRRLFEDKAEYETASLWLMDNGANPQTPVACNMPLVAVRANAHAYDLKAFTGRSNELMRILVGGYLILDRRGIRDNPDFDFIFRFPEDAVPEGLTKVFEIADPRLVIYRVDAPITLIRPRWAQMRGHPRRQ